MVSFRVLDRFLHLADSGRLFLSRDNAWYADLRLGLRGALEELLFWQRPELEISRGIDWAYAIFRDRVELFEAWAGQEDEFAAMQTRLFLALLPFPGQWAWIEKLAAEHGKNRELRSFLHHEKTTIQKKIENKSYKRFRLQNFCQILKAPRLPLEKGVLRVFSLPYLFVVVPELLQTISESYLLYVEPAAGITFRHTWLRVYSRLEDPVLFGLSSHEDRAFVLGQPNVASTRLAHGDYLNAVKEVPLNRNKSFDIVFNNTFDERDRKRHGLMLDLMNHPWLKNIRVLFMGRGTAENVDDFQLQINKRGLDSRATILVNIPRGKVPGYLAQCRIGVHLALMENGCRAVYEYLRSNLPCVMSTCTAGMDSLMIEPRTGMLAMDRDLPGAIVKTLERVHEFTPRTWFLENSGSVNATRQLNLELKELFLSRGYEWQEDIVPLVSSGVGRYADPRDLKRFHGEFKRLTAVFASHPKLPILFR
ncbi:MAG: glycosyltransferase [Desulfobacterium sp.]|nr:glycosyltransferase [Desulfobacterium sp.]